MTNVKRIVSGLQPTGSLHLGNYFGAIQQWKALAEVAEKSYFFIADLHALTEVLPAVERRKQIEDMLLMVMACGLDPEQVNLFRQSEVLYHTELAWYLMCTARTGWLNRMVQYKEKGGNDVEAAFRAGMDVGMGLMGSPSKAFDDAWAGYDQNRLSVSAGLYTYPVLQAADILLYGATHVPVGEDQFQHLQLTRDIAQSFNSAYGEVFHLPEALITKVGGRIMSLYDPQKKMSKSDPNVDHRIELLDDPATIARKIKRATSDSEMLPETFAELSERPAARNLVTMYAAARGLEPDEVMDRFSGRGFGVLKPTLTDALVELLEPIQSRYRELNHDREGVLRQLSYGAGEVLADAEDVMVRVRNALYS